MRMIAAAILLIASISFGMYAQTLSNLTHSASLMASQVVMKTTLFHASFGLIGASLFLGTSKGVFRVLTLIPALLALTSIWKVLHLWPQIFP